MDEHERAVVNKARNDLFRSWISLRDYRLAHAADLLMSVYEYLCRKEQEYDREERERYLFKESASKKAAGKKEHTG